MLKREDIGSWLEGPPRPTDGAKPGERLGLPASGPGSLAPFGRRLVALFIDGIIAQLVATAFLGFDQGQTGVAVFKPLLVVLVMNVLLVSTIGTTLGHRLMGLRVERAPRGYVGFARGITRSVLLCLAIPPLVVDSDGRGLHDRLAQTVIVRV